MSRSTLSSNIITKHCAGFAVGAVLFGCYASVGASTYYVSPSGDDHNGGSINAPLASLTEASRRAMPGDTVCMRGGVYRWTQRQTLKARNGAIPIRFIPYESEHPEFDASGIQGKVDAVTISGTGLSLSGLEVYNSRKNGIVVWGGSKIRIKDCIIHDCVESGVLGTYTQPFIVNDVTIDHCQVYHTALVNFPANPKNLWPPAIFANGAVDFKVYSCTVDDNDGEGIDFDRCMNSSMQANRVFDNYSVNLYLDNGVDCAILGNLSYCTDNRKFFRDGQPASGIQVAIEPHTLNFPTIGLHRIRIADNMVTNCRYGISYGKYGLGGGVQDLTVENNTVIGATQALVHIPDDPSHSGLAFRNNVMVQKNGHQMTDTPGIRDLHADHNMWFGGDASALRGKGDVIKDPQLSVGDKRRPQMLRISRKKSAYGRELGARRISYEIPPVPDARPDEKKMGDS